MYLGYFSNIACELAGWGLSENNRVKASKILSLAEKIETEYRKAYNISINQRFYRILNLLILRVIPFKIY